MKNDKDTLRRKGQIIRQSIDQRYRKEKQIVSNLLSLKINNEDVVAGYYPNKTEVNIMPYIEYLENKGISVCLPYIKNKKSHLLFRNWDRNTSLQNGMFNILTPSSGIFCEPSILLIPLIFFDSEKNRLGYGGGFYDRTISFLEKKKKILKIGVAFEEQKIDSIPSMRYDEKLDMIITQDGITK